MGEDTTLMGNGQVCLLITALESYYQNSYKSSNAAEVSRKCLDKMQDATCVTRKLLLGLVAFWSLSILSFFLKILLLSYLPHPVSLAKIF